MNILRSLLIAGFLSMFLPVTAHAANCGPGQAHPTCVCGDTVTANYTMTADLFCSSGHGLRVAGSKKLDCAGHSITGVNAVDTYGVYISDASFAWISNCGVYNFHRGIRLNNASWSYVVSSASAFNGNFTTHVGYGVDIAGGSIGSTLYGLTVYNNADEGVHVGSGSGGAQILQNNICGNYRENLYLIESHNNTMLSNNLGGDCFGYVSAGNPVYIKDSNHTFLEYNLFNKNAVHVTGASSGTVLYYNAYSGGASYVEDCYAGGGCPSDTITTFP